MRRARRSLAAAVLAPAVLLALPGSAPARGLQEAIDCTNAAYLAWNPQSTTSTLALPATLGMCAARFGAGMTDPKATDAFARCLDEAVAAYEPIRGFEPTAAIAVYCVETYFGSDIAIDPYPGARAGDRPAQRPRTARRALRAGARRARSA